MPTGLVSALTVAGGDAKIRMCSYEDELQPTFSFWHTDVISELEEAVNNEKLAGFKQLLEFTQYQPFIIKWRQKNTNPFFNVNTVKDLDKARHVLRYHGTAAWYFIKQP